MIAKNTGTILKFLTFTLIVIGFSSRSHAQEAKFKALFIYKFYEYIEWPGGKDKVVVGVVGKSEVYTNLQKFAAAKSDISVISINSPSETSKCDILFIPRSSKGLISTYATAIGTKSILLVTNMRSLVGDMADIGFYSENGKLRFAISEGKIKGKKMLPSSKLLSLGASK